MEIESREEPDDDDDGETVLAQSVMLSCSSKYGMED
jgi:hypothetical protein